MTALLNLLIIYYFVRKCDVHNCELIPNMIFNTIHGKLFALMHGQFGQNPYASFREINFVPQ